MFQRLVSFPLIAIVFGSIAFAQTTLVYPITAEGRWRWLASENIAPAVLLENVVVGAEDTRVNSPREYGPHWEGFGKRVGMITADYGVKTVMEAGLGSVWGEDPRYDHTEGKSLGYRVGHVIKMTFLAYDRAGNTMPAYARYLAIPGSSFLSNTWRPDSQSTVSDALTRTALGFLGRMGDNAYKEFRPRHH